MVSTIVENVDYITAFTNVNESPDLCSCQNRSNDFCAARSTHALYICTLDFWLYPTRDSLLTLPIHLYLENVNTQ